MKPFFIYWFAGNAKRSGTELYIHYKIFQKGEKLFEVQVRRVDIRLYHITQGGEFGLALCISRLDGIRADEGRSGMIQVSCMGVC